jgi:hypothetical protein
MKATVGLLASLVLLTSFVFHDVLMAFDGHDAPPVVVQQAPATHPGAPDRRGAHHAPDGGPLASMPDPQSADCGTTQPATLPHITDGIHLPCVIVPVLWSSDDATIGCTVSSLVVPGHPAAVRRALLQVYRN